MVFNSLQYLIFLPVIFIIYQFVPQRHRWLLLSLASLIFYAAFQMPELLLALMFVVSVTYIFGRRLGANNSVQRNKTLLLVSGILLNLVPLLLLKYLVPLFLPHTAWYTGVPGKIFDGEMAGIATAIGVSFYTFQAISYLVDIYLEIIEPENHFGILFLSISFFPKIVQGPIERSGNLIPQLHVPYEFDYQKAKDGFKQIGFGLFKKLVLAGRIGLFVDPIYNSAHEFSAASLLFATYLYAFQIYFDFSAYTDIALGSAKLFNIRLTNNFNKPYLATSVAEFWRRWHISFSSWILDYIFKPLQMYWRKWKIWGTMAALMITFIISGIWHGASWGFVVWGFLHGVYLCLDALYSPYERKLKKKYRFFKSKFYTYLRIFITFNLVSLAWIFFRTDTIDNALYIVSHIFMGIGNLFSSLLHNPLSNGMISGFIDSILMGQSLGSLLLLILILAVYAIICNLAERYADRFSLDRYPWYIRWSAYYFLVIITILIGVHSQSKFIYFQF